MSQKVQRLVIEHSFESLELEASDLAPDQIEDKEVQLRSVHILPRERVYLALEEPRIDVRIQE